MTGKAHDPEKNLTTAAHHCLPSIRSSSTVRGAPFSRMLTTVRKTIENSSMLTQGDHLVVAISGGPDSVALLRALILLSSEYRLRLTTAHLNHGLRGTESEEEADFVRRISNEMGIACICKTADIRLLRSGKGQSLEEIGREERYRFLNDTADRVWRPEDCHRTSPRRPSGNRSDQSDSGKRSRRTKRNRTGAR